MKPLYFAPINKYGNYVYRHLLLQNGADYVFSEMIVVKDIHLYPSNWKVHIIREDIPKTVFQIAAASVEEIDKGVEYVCEHIKDPAPVEINLNMGCPSSGMRKQMLCAGILFHKDHMKELCARLAQVCKERDIISSVKLRLGTSKEDIEIDEFLKIISSAGIKKVYIHARTLGHGYHLPARYEPLVGIKDKFPELEIVINGDIFSSVEYEDIVSKVENDGVMVGRSAMYNPCVFNQIKNGIKPKKGSKNPVHMDPELLKDEDNIGDIILGPNRKKALFDFLETAQEEDMPMEVFRYNIHLMVKGITGHQKISKKVNEETDLSEFIDFLKELLDQ